MVSSGMALLILTVLGIFGLIRGQADTDQSKPITLATPVPARLVDRAGIPQTVFSTHEAESFARSVARALFTGDARRDAGVSEWAPELVDIADPSEAAAVASDVRNYLPSIEMWQQLSEFGTRQWIRIKSVSTPRSWSTALEQAAPGQIPPDAAAFTVTGTSYRRGIWGEAVVANPDDVEAAFAAYETVMFARSAEEAVAAHGTIDLIFGSRAPMGLANLFNGTDEDAE